MRVGGSVPYAEPRPDDGLPIFDEAPLRAVAFGRQAIRPPNRRGALAVIGWAGALVAIVGIGVLAGGPLPAPAPAADAAGAGAGAAQAGASQDLPAFGWPPEARTIPSVARLESPWPALVEITTPRLVVAGTMQVRAERVVIALEARGNRVLDQVWVDVADPDGGIRPGAPVTFETSFDLPYPRPNGTMWVVVTAYGPRDMPLGAIRRPFEVGPIVAPGPWGGHLPPVFSRAIARSTSTTPA